MLFGTKETTKQNLENRPVYVVGAFAAKHRELHMMFLSFFSEKGERMFLRLFNNLACRGRVPPSSLFTIDFLGDLWWSLSVKEEFSARCRCLLSEQTISAVIKAHCPTSPY